MPTTSPAPAPVALGRRAWLAIIAFWTLFGVLESTNAYLNMGARGIPLSPVRALVGNMPWWLLWAVLTAPILFLARRVRIGSAPTTVAVGVHLVASVVVAAVHVGVVGTLFYHTHGWRVMPSAWAQVRAIAAGYLPLEVLTYWLVLGGYYAFEYHRRYRAGELAAARHELRAAQLESQMSEARLAMLRMELNPHFLFNALNAISGLVRRREHDDAVRMLAVLGDLLRQTLARDGAAEVPLERELELLGRYLELERLRFRDRLAIEIDAAPAVRAAAVPPLILQPLVENAVRHGVARRPGAGLVRVRARRAGDALELVVQDSGAGFPLRHPPREGVGLANTRARLAQLYGERGELHLDNAPGGGAQVTVRLPFHELALAPGVEHAVATA